MALKENSSRLGKPARRKALRIPGAIARDLGMQIVSGRFKPGDLLPGEVEASGRLQVSRAAYREAVRILTAKGLVRAFTKVGTRVSPQAQWHLLDPDVLAWLFEFDPDENLLKSLFELRRMVEPEAAALAAERHTASDLTAMSDALKRMARHTLKTKEGRQADQEFHAVVLRSTGNPFVQSLTAGIGAAITWTTIYKDSRSARLRDSMPDHKVVYEAVAARDTVAARMAMRRLLELAARDTTHAHRRKAPK